jgi:hypothetical protein
MALAAVGGMALLATGTFSAGAAGILIVAVASGVGLRLSTIAQPQEEVARRSVQRTQRILRIQSLLQARLVVTGQQETAQAALRSS